MVARMLLSLIGIILSVASVSADHLGWMERYKTASGGSCCADRDCIEAAVIPIGPGWVIINGVEIRIPSSSMHPLPPHVPSGGMWCYRGFFTGGPPPQVSPETTLCVFFRSGEL